MIREEIEKQYRDLPTSFREQWDLERFVQLSNERVNLATHPQYALAGLEREAQAKPPRELAQNEFYGMASVYDVVIDTWMPSIIESGAFKKTLGDKAQMKRVKVLWMHYQPLGVPTHMAEVKNGLEVIGKVADTTLGRDAMTLVREGAVDEMSIGFDPTEFMYKEISGVWHRIISEVNLWEFSLVDFGANSAAKVTAFNSLRGLDPEMDAAIDRVAARLGGQGIQHARVREPAPEPGRELVTHVKLDLEPLRDLLEQFKQEMGRSRPETFVENGSDGVDVDAVLEELNQLESLSAAR